MTDIAMVMPMAGRGSRFAKLGFDLPKPLIPLHGRPFFWWAAESLRRQVRLSEMIFVVLEEHCRDFAIDRRVREFYPEARIVAIADVTGGAAETAMVGLAERAGDGPVAINDCDHAFECPSVRATVERLVCGAAAGALMCFSSRSAAYSYAEVEQATGTVVRTVEKRPISAHAIGGCYFVGDPRRFEALYQRYVEDCPYQELFMSGMFNLMIDRGDRVGMLEASLHRSFGTPDEMRRMDERAFGPLLAWK